MGKQRLLKTMRYLQIRLWMVLRIVSKEEGTAPERWILITVEEAYIHCSKHIPHLKKLDKKIHWGTDKETHKGGDFFKAETCD